MCGKIKHDKIRNDNIIDSFEVTLIVEKMIENRLGWF